MNVYQIVMEEKYNNNECGEPNFLMEYIVHENKFSYGEFSKICDEALSKCKNKDSYELVQILIKHYDFRYLPITLMYEFVEE